jgi:Cft2 family RNA processing exonuclease/dsRNA-specific ribonuclease
MGDLTGLSIQFLGGADEIGASCAVISVGGTTLIVDCGVRFKAGRALPDLAAISGLSPDAILVTHAHTDHTGGLPVVHEAWPAIPILMSPPTVDLVRILTRDALHLMAEAFKRGGEVPLYNEVAVESMFHVTRGVKHGETVTIGAVEATWLPSSHILGASMIHLATPAGNVLFTGDYSVEAQRTVPALSRPPLPVDLVVTESTYGNRLHEDRKSAERRLVGRVRETIDGGGRVLIPAFAIGRAQEVILILRSAIERGELPDVPVFVDGMVRAVCDVYPHHPRYVTNALAKRMRRGHPFYTDRILPVTKPEDRRALLDTGPAVIVSSSGMLSGGPSAFYAGELAGNERDAILLTGYQDEESPGRALLGLAEQEGPRTMRLLDRQIEVRCSFSTYGLSAHADRMQMVGLLEGLSPECVILVHGDKGAKRNLAGSLGCRDVVHAGNGDRIDRRYRGRRGPPPRHRPIELGLAQARSLLADVPGNLLRIDRLAEAFFGAKAKPMLVERLVLRLEELGVAVRDDHRRDFLRIDIDDPAEEALAETLKAENPKGRLLEYLTRCGAPAPEFITADLAGGRCRVEVDLELDGRTFSSGAQEAGSPRVAEQLAARALLASIEEIEDIAEATVIDEEESDRLKAENPKGRLIEACAAAKLPFPEFSVRPLPGGDFAGTARLRAEDGEVIESRPYRAPAAKTVEQGVARDLLDRLPAPRPAGEGDANADGPPTRAGQEARLLLNRYQQTGQIADFGYELLETRGPPHRPEFIVRAFVDTPAGERLFSDEVTAHAKQEAHRRAAEAMVARLRR